MSAALDALAERLAISPRLDERLELHDLTFDSASRDAARRLLLAAADAGDARAPDALGYVVGRDALAADLGRLLREAPPAVAVEAGEALQRLLREDATIGLKAALAAGQVPQRAMGPAARLLIALGGEAVVRDALRATASGTARAELADALWSARGYDGLSLPWWAPLKLLRTQLGLPFASFHVPATARLVALLEAPSLRAAGYTVALDDAPPAAVQAALNDMRRPADQPFPDAILGPLEPAGREAIITFAADAAATRRQPRGIRYVARLAPRDHEDVVNWAEEHASAAYRAAGALAREDAATA